jgi:hypothetical protein
MFDKRDGQHLAQLLFISKLRNLANYVSHDRSVLTAEIFGVMTTRHFLTVFNSKLGHIVNCAVSAWHHMQPLLELKTRPRVCPVS